VRKLKKLIIAIAMAGPAACLAGPFCVVVSGMGQDCHYYDEASLRASGRGPARRLYRQTHRNRNAVKQRVSLLPSGGRRGQVLLLRRGLVREAAQDQGGTCLQRPRFGS